MAEDEDLRVLILDDEPIDADMIAAELAHGDFVAVIEYATDRFEYAKQLNDFDPMVVILDYHVPGLPWEEALEMVRRDCPETYLRVFHPPRAFCPVEVSGLSAC